MQSLERQRDGRNDEMYSHPGRSSRVAVIAACSAAAGRSRCGPVPALRHAAAAAAHRRRRRPNRSTGDVERTTFDPDARHSPRPMTRRASGLYVQDLVIGTGAVAARDAHGVVRYTGWLPERQAVRLAARSPSRSAPTRRFARGRKACSACASAEGGGSCRRHIWRTARAARRRDSAELGAGVRDGVAYSGPGRRAVVGPIGRARCRLSMGGVSGHRRSPAAASSLLTRAVFECWLDDHAERNRALETRH